MSLLTAEDHKKLQKIIKANDKASRKADKKVKAIQSGKYSDNRLIRIIKNNKNGIYTKELACKYIKQERKLHKLLFMELSHDVKKLICNHLSKLDGIGKLLSMVKKQELNELSQLLINRIESIQIKQIKTNHYNDQELLELLMLSDNNDLHKEAMLKFKDHQVLSKWILEKMTPKKFVYYASLISIENFEVAIKQINNFNLVKSLYEEISNSEKNDLLVNCIATLDFAFEALKKISFHKAPDSLFAKIKSKDQLIQLAEFAKSGAIKEKAKGILAKLVIEQQDDELALKLLTESQNLDYNIIKALIEKYREQIDFMILEQKAKSNDVRMLAITQLIDNIMSSKSKGDPSYYLIEADYLSNAHMHGLLDMVTDSSLLTEIFLRTKNESLIKELLIRLSDRFELDYQLESKFLEYIEKGLLEIDAQTTPIILKLGKRIVDKYENKKCEMCNGTGREPYMDYGDPCSSCDGRGHDEVVVGKQVV